MVWFCPQNGPSASVFPATLRKYAELGAARQKEMQVSEAVLGALGIVKREKSMRDEMMNMLILSFPDMIL